MRYPTPFQFFHKHAGFSFDPAKETRAQGRSRCAKALVNAEARTRDLGVCFHWEEEPAWDSDRSGIEHDAPLWCCTAYDLAGSVIGSLGGIDFGPDSNPFGSPYRRIVEAEIALEASDIIR